MSEQNESHVVESLSITGILAAAVAGALFGVSTQ